MNRIERLCEIATEVILAEGSIKYCNLDEDPNYGRYFVTHSLIPKKTIIVPKNGGPYESTNDLKLAIQKALKSKWRCVRYSIFRNYYDEEFLLMSDPYSFKDFVRNCNNRGLL